ncbi:SEC-C metal-binding domain-containing protein [Candidatus Desulfovibrio trichonymphae]
MPSRAVASDAHTCLSGKKFQRCCLQVEFSFLHSINFFRCVCPA